MLDRALVRRLFCMIESSEKSTCGLCENQNPDTENGYITRDHGATAGAIGGKICGSIPPVVGALEMGSD